VLRDMAIPCSNFRTFPLLRNSWDQLWKQQKYIKNKKTETGTLKKPSDKLNTGSRIRTSTFPKWTHPK